MVAHAVSSPFVEVAEGGHLELRRGKEMVETPTAPLVDGARDPCRLDGVAVAGTEGVGHSTIARKPFQDSALTCIPSDRIPRPAPVERPPTTSADGAAHRRAFVRT